MTEAARKRVRTCIGCGKQSAKSDFARIVRTPDGAVMFDESGRSPGRGAYVCSADCLRNALKARKLQRALKVNVDNDNVERIAEHVLAAFADETIR